MRGKYRQAVSLLLLHQNSLSYVQTLEKSIIFNEYFLIVRNKSENLFYQLAECKFLDRQLFRETFNGRKERCMNMHVYLTLIWRLFTACLQ